MDSSPINALVQLQSAAAVGRETRPLPPQLAKLPADSLIDAVVIRQEPGNIVQLASKLGNFRIKAEHNLLKHLLHDSSVTLRILNKDSGTQARIVTVNNTPVHQLNAPKGEQPSVIVETGNRPTAQQAPPQAPTIARPVQAAIAQSLPNPTLNNLNPAALNGVTSTANPALKPLQTLSVTLAGTPTPDQASLLVNLLSGQTGRSSPAPGSGQHVLVRLYQLAQPSPTPLPQAPTASPKPTTSAAITSAPPALSPQTPQTQPTTSGGSVATSATTAPSTTSPTPPPLTPATGTPTATSTPLTTPPTTASPSPTVATTTSNNPTAQTTAPLPPQTPTTPTAQPNATSQQAVHAYQHQNQRSPRPLLPVTIQQPTPFATPQSTPSPTATPAATPTTQAAPPPITLFSQAIGQFTLPSTALSPSINPNQPIWVEILPAETSERTTPKNSQWDGVRQLLQSVSTAPDAASLVPQLRALLPQPSLTLPHTTLFLMTMLRGGDMRQWLGQELLNTLEQLPAARGTGNASTAPLQDMAATQRLFNDTANSPWQVLMLPMLVKEEVQPARLYMKPKKPSRDGESETTRFVIEVNLSALGALQLDNLFTAPKHPTSDALGDLSLTIRTSDALDEEVQDDIRQLYYITLEQLTLSGRCQFIHGQPFPTASMESVINRSLRTL